MSFLFVQSLIMTVQLPGPSDPYACSLPVRFLETLCRKCPSLTALTSDLVTCPFGEPAALAGFSNLQSLSLGPVMQYIPPAVVRPVDGLVVSLQPMLKACSKLTKLRLIAKGMDRFTVFPGLESCTSISELEVIPAAVEASAADWIEFLKRNSAHLKKLHIAERLHGSYPVLRRGPSPTEVTDEFFYMLDMCERLEDLGYYVTGRGRVFVGSPALRRVHVEDIGMRHRAYVVRLYSDILASPGLTEVFYEGVTNTAEFCDALWNMKPRLRAVWVPFSKRSVDVLDTLLLFAQSTLEVFCYDPKVTLVDELREVRTRHGNTRVQLIPMHVAARAEHHPVLKAW